jgi:hypothetical protein
MLGIILLVLLYFILMIVAMCIIANIVKGSYCQAEDFWQGTILFGVLLALGFMLITVPVIQMTGGLMNNYSEGVREGYITQLSRKGIIWETNEGQMQVGTGEMASLQTPWQFSCPDESMWSKLNKSLGKKVRVQYRQWLFQPYSRGDSGYEIQNIEILEGKSGRAEQ